jgi:hypothetical protein
MTKAILIAALALTVTAAAAESCTRNHELFRIVPEYRAVMLDGGAIDALYAAESKKSWAERLWQRFFGSPGRKAR